MRRIIRVRRGLSIRCLVFADGIRGVGIEEEYSHDICCGLRHFSVGIGYYTVVGNSLLPSFRRGGNNGGYYGSLDRWAGYLLSSVFQPSKLFPGLPFLPL